MLNCTLVVLESGCPVSLSLVLRFEKKTILKKRLFSSLSNGRQTAERESSDSITHARCLSDQEGFSSETIFASTLNER
jgi:hypothetical protein